MCNKNSAVLSDILNLLTHSLSLIIDDKNLDEDIRNNLKADISKLRGINSALTKTAMDETHPQPTYMVPPPPPSMPPSMMPPRSFVPFMTQGTYNPHMQTSPLYAPLEAVNKPTTTPIDGSPSTPGIKHSIQLSLMEEDCKELISKINSYNHNNDLSKDDRVEFAILKRTTLYNEKGSRCLTSFKVFGAKERILEVLELYGIFGKN